MEKINIAELLKDCPKGMELDCYLFDRLKFDHIDTDNKNYPIVCRAKTLNGEYNIHAFTKYGWYNAFFDYSKCVIFPKGKTTWEGFYRPFKVGDIVFTTLGNIAIIRESIGGELFYVYGIMVGNGFYKDETAKVVVERLATEEEKAELFDAIKANGYKWNEETKTLEKLIQPKFKVGDRIRQKGELSTYTISDVNDAHYFCGKYVICDICDDNWELVPDKFDINTLVPFESRVLVRDKNSEEWRGQFFSHYANGSDRQYVCIGIEGLCEYKKCIPYEGNEHLLGKTDDCNEYFKSWK